MFKPPSVGAATMLAFVALIVGVAGARAADPSGAASQRDSPWGVAPSAALSYDPERWLPAMVDAGVTSVRGFHAPPAPAQDRLAPITAAGMAAVGVLQWSAGTPQTLPVDDLAGWRRYVAAQVLRFKGQVKYWEVWNEPPNFTVDRSPASYAKVVAAAFDAAKAVDPTIQIGLAAKSNHVNWLAESIAAGAADKFDFVTLHPYELVSLLPQGWEGPFMAVVPRVRQMLRQKNPAKAMVPVWFTEVGISAATPAQGGVDPSVQADVLVKVYTMSLAQGVARTYWFDPSDSESLSMGLTTADGIRRPAWHALRSLVRHLGVRPRYIGWMRPGGDGYGFVFEGPDGVVLVAWSSVGEAVVLPLAQEVVRVDPRTGTSGATGKTRAVTLSPAPMVMVSPKASAQARQWVREAAGRSTQPFGWRGDHSASRSLRLTAGARADGVFMVNAPAVTLVDGVAEFNMAGTGGARFAVDPVFLPYAGTPIRITAVVRGHGSGDPGFNLKYESDASMASVDGNGLVRAGGGWFRIDGSIFYEKTWVVPNARFVGMYGYHFAFDTDGPAHAGFSIQSVTVSR